MLCDAWDRHVPAHLLHWWLGDVILSRNYGMKSPRGKTRSVPLACTEHPSDIRSPLWLFTLHEVNLPLSGPPTSLLQNRRYNCMTSHICMTPLLPSAPRPRRCCRTAAMTVWRHSPVWRHSSPQRSADVAAAGLPLWPYDVTVRGGPAVGVELHHHTPAAGGATEGAQGEYVTQCWRCGWDLPVSGAEEEKDW